MTISKPADEKPAVEITGPMARKTLAELPDFIREIWSKALADHDNYPLCKRMQFRHLRRGGVRREYMCAIGVLGRLYEEHTGDRIDRGRQYFQGPGHGFYAYNGSAFLFPEVANWLGMPGDSSLCTIELGKPGSDGANGMVPGYFDAFGAKRIIEILKGDD